MRFLNGVSNESAAPAADTPAATSLKNEFVFSALSARMRIPKMPYIAFWGPCQSVEPSSTIIPLLALARKLGGFDDIN